MAFGTLRADTIQADGGTAKTVDNLVVSGGDIGAATATTPATGDDDTSVATTAFVKAQAYATLASPTFTGTVTLPAGTVATTPSAGDNDTSVATTAYVQAEGFTKAASANQWTAGQRAELTNVDSSSGTLTLDLDASNNFLCITTENITTVTYSNLDADAVGQTGSIFFQYGGAHTVGGWAAASRWAGGTGGANGAPTMTATSGKCDRVDYVVVRDADSAGNQRVQLIATLNYED